MRNELVLDTAEQMRALAHPVRQQVLRLLTNDALTNKQLAVALHEPPSRVHFHVRELFNAGLIELVSERPKGGVIEKYYRAVARHMRLSSTLSDLGLINEQRVHFSRPFAGKHGARSTTLFSGKPLVLSEDGLPGATFDAARQELARAVAYFRGSPPNTLIAHEHARLSADALARVQEHLEMIDEELRRARASSDTSANDHPIMLTYVLHSLPPDQPNGNDDVHTAG